MVNSSSTTRDLEGLQAIMFKKAQRNNNKPFNTHNYRMQQIIKSTGTQKLQTFTNIATISLYQCFVGGYNSHYWELKHTLARPSPQNHC